MPCFGTTYYAACFGSEALRATSGVRLSDYQLEAVDKLVKDLWKWTGFDWNEDVVGVLPGIRLEKMFRCFYPFVGGTAGAHGINLVNPSGPQIKWTGTITHNANGVISGASAAQGNTQIGVTGVDVEDAYIMIGCMSRTNTASAGAALGAWDATVAGAPGLEVKNSGDNKCYSYLGATGIASTAVVDGRGWFATMRTDSIRTSLYRNSAMIANSAAANVGTPPDHVTEFAIFQWGVGYAGGGDTSRGLTCAFVTYPTKTDERFLDHLFSQRAIAELYNAVWAFDEDLGRQVTAP
jgi:hypothetical protein